jgi:hypothetical protein
VKACSAVPCRLLAGADEEAVVAAGGMLQPKDLTIDFRFDNLGLKLKGSGKPVLMGVTGEIR